MSHMNLVDSTDSFSAWKANTAQIWTLRTKAKAPVRQVELARPRLLRGACGCRLLWRPWLVSVALVAELKREYICCGSSLVGTARFAAAARLCIAAQKSKARNRQ